MPRFSSFNWVLIVSQQLPKPRIAAASCQPITTAACLASALALRSTVGEAGPLPVLAGQDIGGTFTGAAITKPRYHTAAKDTSGLQVIDSLSTEHTGHTGSSTEHFGCTAVAAASP